MPDTLYQLPILDPMAATNFMTPLAGIPPGPLPPNADLQPAEATSTSVQMPLSNQPLPPPAELSSPLISAEPTMWDWRLAFYSRHQRQGETIENWLKNLSEMAEKAKFGDTCCGARCRADRLLDLIVIGMIESDEKKCIRAAADSMKATFTLQQALTLTGKPDLQFINDSLFIKQEEPSSSQTGSTGIADAFGNENFGFNDDVGNNAFGLADDPTADSMEVFHKFEENDSESETDADHSEEEDKRSKRKLKKKIKAEHNGISKSEKLEKALKKMFIDLSNTSSANPDLKTDPEDQMSKDDLSRQPMDSEELEHWSERPVDQIGINCSVCKLTVIDDRELRSHIETAHGAVPAAQCRVCFCVIYDSSRLTRHRARHKSMLSSKTTSDIVYTNSSIVDLHRRVDSKCNKCDEICESEFALRKHKKRFHPQKRLFIPSYNNDQTYCAPCDKTFPEAKHFKRHYKETHMDLRPYACEFCPGIAYKQKNHLYRHYSSSHIGKLGEPDAEKLFKAAGFCTTCGKGFYSAYELKEHEQTAHDVTMLQCPKCDKMIKGAKLMKRHMQDMHEDRIKTHPEEVHYCSKCYKSFPTKRQVVVHERNSHGLVSSSDQTRIKGSGVMMTPGKPRQLITGDILKCRWCDYRANTLGSRRAHEYDYHKREKGEFPCDQCGKVFDYNKGLRYHMRNVHGEASLACTVCGKKFKQMPNLQRHQRMHQGIKEWACTICGKDWLEKCNAKEHVVKVHHKEKVESESFIQRLIPKL